MGMEVIEIAHINDHGDGWTDVQIKLTVLLFIFLTKVLLHSSG